MARFTEYVLCEVTPTENTYFDDSSSKNSLHHKIGSTLNKSLRRSVKTKKDSIEQNQRIKKILRLNKSSRPTPPTPTPPQQQQQQPDQSEPRQTSGNVDFMKRLKVLATSYPTHFLKANAIVEFFKSNSSDYTLTGGQLRIRGTERPFDVMENVIAMTSRNNPNPPKVDDDMMEFLRALRSVRFPTHFITNGRTRAMYTSLSPTGRIKAETPSRTPIYEHFTPAKPIRTPFDVKKLINFDEAIAE